MKDGIIIVITQVLILFFAFFAMNYGYMLHEEIILLRKDMAAQRIVVRAAAKELTDKKSEIKELKQMVDTLEKDNQQLYKEVIDMNREIQNLKEGNLFEYQRVLKYL